MMLKNNVEEFKTKKLLAHAIAKLDENTVFNLVKLGLQQGINPYTLIEEATDGMNKVGDLYNSGRYFIGDLIVAADIFEDMLSLVLKEKNVSLISDLPPIVFGTVEEDIHDIGKNIAIGVLKGSGLQVVDLGVDVPPIKFVEAVHEAGSNLVCLSGLITPSYDSMKKTVDKLYKEGLRPGVSVIIGGLVNEAVKRYTGADYWVTNCNAIKDLCGSLLQGNKKTAITS